MSYAHVGLDVMSLRVNEGALPLVCRLGVPAVLLISVIEATLAWTQGEPELYLQAAESVFLGVAGGLAYWAHKRSRRKLAAYIVVIGGSLAALFTAVRTPASAFGQSVVVAMVGFIAASYVEQRRHVVATTVCALVAVALIGAVGAMGGPAPNPLVSAFTTIIASLVAGALLVVAVVVEIEHRRLTAIDEDRMASLLVDRNRALRDDLQAREAAHAELRARSLDRNIAARLVRELESELDSSVPRRLGRSFAHDLDLTSLSHYLETFERRGLGQVSLDKSREEVYRFRARRLIESAALPDGGRQPRCHFTLGYLEGAVGHAAGGAQTLGVELECAASSGADICRFEVRVRRIRTSPTRISPSASRAGTPHLPDP